MLRLFSVCFLMVLFLPFFGFQTVAQAGDPSADRLGAIIELEGDVTILRKGGTAQKAAVNDLLYLGDTVSTHDNARAFIYLIDETEFTLSENARFQIQQYIYDPDNSDKNKARYSILTGAFRYVSGMVAQKENPDVEVSTPFGAIGIRGTDFTVAREDDGYGVFVDSGRVHVQNNYGAALLNKGDGTFVRSRRHAPDPVKKWGAKRIEKLRVAVKLKREKELRQRLELIKGKRKERLEKWRENRNNRQNLTPDPRREELKEKLQERRENFKKMDREERREKFLKNREKREGGNRIDILRRKKRMQDAAE